MSDASGDRDIAQTSRKKKGDKGKKKKKDGAESKKAKTKEETNARTSHRPRTRARTRNRGRGDARNTEHQTMLSTLESRFGSRILLLSTHRAQRRNSEPATTDVPASSIMPRYDPPPDLRIAPAAGPPQSALPIQSALTFAMFPE